MASVLVPKGDKFISDEEFSSIEEGDTVTTRKGEQYRITSARSVNVWGKLLQDADLKGNSIPITRSQLRSIERCKADDLHTFVGTKVVLLRFTVVGEQILPRGTEGVVLNFNRIPNTLQIQVNDNIYEIQRERVVAIHRKRIMDD